MVGEGFGRPPLQQRGREGFTQNRQGNRSGAADPRHRTSGNGCGRGPKSKGKAETASRDKNVSGAADSGESRRGGTRAVSFAFPCHIKSWRAVDRPQLSLTRRPGGEARVSASGPRKRIPDPDPKNHSARRSGNPRQSALPERQDARN